MNNNIINRKNALIIRVKQDGQPVEMVDNEKVTVFPVEKQVNLRPCYRCLHDVSEKINAHPFNGGLSVDVRDEVYTTFINHLGGLHYEKTGTIGGGNGEHIQRLIQLECTEAHFLRLLNSYAASICCH